MCGIYCSNDLSTFEILEEANRKRGNFSTGIFYCYNKANYNIIQEKGNINWNKTKIPHQKGHLYLGRGWQEETSHPFWVGDWIVAHNGVLTNSNELIDEFIPMHDNPVDSSIIPALLDEFEYTHGPCEDAETEVQNILYTIEKLKGTFALWIVNIKTMNIYIARQGSTLFYKDSNISSIRGCDYKEISQGILYNFSYEGLTEIDSFVYDSPFLTL